MWLVMMMPGMQQEHNKRKQEKGWAPRDGIFCSFLVVFCFFPRLSALRLSYQKKREDCLLL